MDMLSENLPDSVIGLPKRNLDDNTIHLETFSWLPIFRGGGVAAAVSPAEQWEAYRQAGVREYWIADGRAKTVEVFILEDESYYLIGKFSSGETAESVVMKGFAIPVAIVFSQ